MNTEDEVNCKMWKDMGICNEAYSLCRKTCGVCGKYYHQVYLNLHCRVSDQLMANLGIRQIFLLFI